MEEQNQERWALRHSDVPQDWPKNADGQPEQAAYLTLESELGGMADVTVSMLASCGIPAFKSGTQGKVILGFAGLGVELYVPISRLEEAKALLEGTECSEEIEE